MPRTLLVIAALALAAAVAPAGAGDGLAPAWLYNPVERPVPVDVVPPPGTGPVTLVLMDARGNLHTDPVEVAPGRVDLGEVMPDVWRLRKAGFLQMMVGDEPVGSALVLQPMLSRLVPLTEEAIAPRGYAYTKIIGWYDEALGPPDVPVEPEGEGMDAAGGAGDEAGAEAAGDPGDDAQNDDAASPAEPPETKDTADPWLAHHEPGPRLFDGLRVYPERDIVLHTDLGDIRIALSPDEAPNTAWNFRALCAGGFYREIQFHRVVPLTRDGDPFVIQAGDPTGTGSGGPGYWLPIEPSSLPHDFGVISMARDVDPDSAGSQIFICLSRAGTARLDGSYCSFGYAVDGAQTILDIAAVELEDVAAGRPVEPPLIVSAGLVPAPARRLGVGRGDRRVERDAKPAPKPARVPR